jgi:hypothetical protein
MKIIHMKTSLSNQSNIEPMNNNLLLLISNADCNPRNTDGNKKFFGNAAIF